MQALFLIFFNFFWNFFGTGGYPPVPIPETLFFQFWISIYSIAARPISSSSSVLILYSLSDRST